MTPGFHTLYVRDKDGCGTASIEIPVIGYPKYFTPNGDDTNDVWQLKGISPNYQSRSIIYIFNRYGKLITRFQASEVGWDGTLNGVKLPPSSFISFVGAFLMESGTDRSPVCATTIYAPGYLVLVLAGGYTGITFDATFGITVKFHSSHLIILPA